MANMPNSPKVKLALVGVSRDCFPREITVRRSKTLVAALKEVGVKVFACPTIIETEAQAMQALAEAREAGCNAAVIYLGNFGPEGPLAIFAQKFGGPVMACAASEEDRSSLVENRGDAYCGMLNASYNFALRNLSVYIPQMPVGLPGELAVKIAHFATVARVVLGIQALKVFGFGPRPQDFFACNAPIRPLYNLGIEVMENSELDLLGLVKAVDEKDAAVKKVAKEMAAELGADAKWPDLLPKMARLEVALKRFAEANLGSRQFAVFADKCWPAFESNFGFAPCYVNSRMASKGIPVACEVDIYGAVSEYICQLATDAPATLLDINNTVPADLIQKGADLMGATFTDLFMGFHCGNTPSCCMKNCALKFQMIMKRLMEPGVPEADISRGTLEGQIRPGPITFFRLQGNVDNKLVSYVAEGNVLDINPESFGGIGIFAIPNFARFYRHVLIAKGFPHHGAVAFEKVGKVLFDAVKLLGVCDINAPLPPNVRYCGENFFEM